jgi:hypothetical protein
MDSPASTRASPERLAASVALLIERVSEPEVRAQLHALVPLLESLDGPSPDPAARNDLEQAITRAMADEDEDALIAAMVKLAALDRSAAGTVAWSAASGG